MKTALVVTSIHPPNAALAELAEGCLEHGWDFHLAGDSKSPDDFSLPGCRFHSLRDQLTSGFTLGECCPERTYTRKNLGYLHAIRDGARVIVETDDDNHPTLDFWKPRNMQADCLPVRAEGWVNVYRYFAGSFIYPRGFPLRHARESVPVPGAPESVACPVQQGLADEDPDVDAVYRMLFPLPLRFDAAHPPVTLSGNAWCPFNSQNTTFFETAFPLLYLPSNCSFRMTDIWRSFIAIRVLQALGQGVLFHAPTVWQERNEHDLQKDFVDEIPGYIHNETIRERLVSTRLEDACSMQVMTERCYETMIRNGWVGAGEEALLQAWFKDLKSLGHTL